MNRTTLFFEAEFSPIEGNAGKSDTDSKETEWPANFHHALADLRCSFAALAEVGKKPQPAAQRARGKQTAGGSIGGERRCGDSDSPEPTAGRQHAFGHRWHEKSECRQVATGTNGTDEEEL